MTPKPTHAPEEIEETIKKIQWLNLKPANDLLASYREAAAERDTLRKEIDRLEKMLWPTRDNR